jgi:hypothetical protein
MATFLDEQVMLCLAALCYRGYSSITDGALHTDLLRARITDGLDDLAPLEGDWELVWGPVAYRARFSMFDDGLMYVVRQRQGPPRYVVAVRGTNPISGFDWVFGDFWTAVQMPWPYANDGSAISLSSALGLAILQRLRADAPDDAVGGQARVVRARALALAAGIRTPAIRFADNLIDVLEPLREMFGAGLTRLNRKLASIEPPRSEARLRAVADALQSEELRVVIEVINDARKLVGPRLDFVLFSLLRADGPSGQTGVELLPFLAAAVEKDHKIDVVVTGHSKGGALAPTLALWLAETQGPGAATNERWDPNGDATIHCYSYAGPTAGNEAFARRSNAKIGGRCHRVMNPLDVVPHAWMPSDLAKVPSLYDGVVPHLHALDSLLTVASGHTGQLRYTQIDTLTKPDASLPGFPSATDPTRPVFFDQFVYQHMEAYLRAFGLTKTGITTQAFFDP